MNSVDTVYRSSRLLIESIGAMVAVREMTQRYICVCGGGFGDSQVPSITDLPESANVQLAKTSN